MLIRISIQGNKAGQPPKRPPPRKGKRPGDSSLYYLLGGLAVLGALIFGTHTPDPADTTVAPRKPRSSRRETVKIGPGSEFYWPWHSNVPAEWDMDDSAWADSRKLQ